MAVSLVKLLMSMPAIQRTLSMIAFSTSTLAIIVTRGGLLITFAVNAVDSDSFNILAICSVTTALLALKGQVYENCYIDALESLFLLKFEYFFSCNILRQRKRPWKC